MIWLRVAVIAFIAYWALRGLPAVINEYRLAMLCESCQQRPWRRVTLVEGAFFAVCNDCWQATRG